MNKEHKHSRRKFLSKALALIVVAASSPATILKPKKLFASNGNEPLSLLTVDLSKYPALSKVNGSVSILIPNTKYTYAKNIVLPFRFILTRTSATAFIALEGYCTHNFYALSAYNGTNIHCPNPNPGHGSNFDINGKVIQTPARTNLAVYTTDYDSVKNTVTIDVANLGVMKDDSSEFAPELFQNFPNPVAGSTAIRFKLGYSARVRLTVTDVLGHTIAVLTDGDLPTGEHSFNFDATIWSAGTYFYHLNIEGLVLSKQMVIVK